MSVQTNQITGEFKIALGWRIFTCIFAPVLIVIFVYAGYGLIRNETPHPWTIYVLAPVFLGGGLLLMYAFVEVLRTRLKIGRDSIRKRNAFRTNTLHFSEIKGFRSNQNYVFLVPEAPQKKEIRISSYLQRGDHIIQWVHATFENLDVSDAEKEREEILSDDTFGINRKDREFRLREAKQVSKYINRASFIVGLWLLVYPKPYSLLSLAAITLPIAALIAIYTYRGLIRFNVRDISAYPTLFSTITLPASALTVRALLDWNILGYQALWPMVLITTAVISALLLMGTKEFVPSKPSHLLAMLVLTVFTLGYTYGAYVILNGEFDRSVPHEYSVDVVEKEIGGGKVTTCHVIISPWDQETEPRKLRVTKRQFDKLKVGENVVLHVMNGFFGTPWAYIISE